MARTMLPSLSFDTPRRDDHRAAWFRRPAIRTQRPFAKSWDLALTGQGPVLLEVNFGGDFNLAQLAHGAGVLDDACAERLRQCGYRL